MAAEMKPQPAPLAEWMAGLSAEKRQLLERLFCRLGRPRPKLPPPRTRKVAGSLGFLREAL